MAEEEWATLEARVLARFGGCMIEPTRRVYTYQEMLNGLPDGRRRGEGVEEEAQEGKALMPQENARGRAIAAVEKHSQETNHDWALLATVEGHTAQWRCRDCPAHGEYNDYGLRSDLEKLRDVHRVQGTDGTWNTDQYMLGMFNGLELALAIFEHREPHYRTLKKESHAGEEAQEHQAPEAVRGPAAQGDVEEHGGSDRQRAEEEGQG